MTEVYINTKYFAGWIKSKYFRGKDFYSIDELLNIIEDLDDELESLKEEYQDYKDYVKSNYKELSYREQVE